MVGSTDGPVLVAARQTTLPFRTQGQPPTLGQLASRAPHKACSSGNNRFRWPPKTLSTGGNAVRIVFPWPFRPVQNTSKNRLKTQQNYSTYPLTATAAVPTHYLFVLVPTGTEGSKLVPRRSNETYTNYPQYQRLARYSIFNINTREFTACCR